MIPLLHDFTDETVLVFGGLAVPLTAVTVGYATLGVAVAAALLYVFFTRV